ncbi:MAG: GDSL-type esterase/lipase family protein, partial [Leifsonia sp.]
MSRLPAILLAPIALAQGRGLQRRVPRMPPASPRAGGARAPDARRLLVLGDSTAVGTGVEQMADAMAGQVARRLPESVAWRAVGENGATSAEVRQRHLPEALAEPADVAVVLVGWNDALQLKSARRFGEHLGAMLDALRERNPDARLVVVGP